MVKFLKVNSSDRERGLYAAPAVRLSNVDARTSLFSKRIKLPANQSECEILFDVSLLSAETWCQSVLPAALPADVYWPRRLIMQGFVLKDHNKREKIILAKTGLFLMTTFFWSCLAAIC